MEGFKEYLNKYRNYIIGVLILTFLDVMIALYLPNLMSNIVDNGIITGDTTYILSVGFRMLVVSVFSLIVMVISSLFSSKAAMGFSKDLRRDVFTHVESFSLGEFSEIGTSSLITRTTNDINQLQQVLMMALRMMVRAPLMLFGGLVMAISKNRQLSIILLVSIPLLVFAIATIGRKGFPLFMKVQEKMDNLNLVLREKLTGVRVIRAFDQSDYEEKRFEEANRELSETVITVNRIMIGMFPVVMIILNFTNIGIVWFGSKQVELGNMMIGDIMAFIQYIMLIMFSLIMFSAIFVVVPRAAASAERLNEVMDIDPSIVDKEETIKIDRVKELEFRNVDFAYPDASINALCDISFKAKKGETIAIIGGTGSGKTSLINLIPRFYDIKNGEILINGIDIRDMNQQELRKHIGYVPQRATLFSGTIKENILQGKEDATEKEMIKAAEIAQATEFINQLEDGYDSYIAQGGTNVSGGQKQRLSIARAIVRQPDIYIFDDSFSALDFKTDANLRSALTEETTESIVIIVAQRVSTVRDADKIIVLDDGEMVGLGNHTELMRDSVVYQEIVRSQLSEEEINNG